MPKSPLLNAIFHPKAIQEQALPTELCSYRPTTLPPTWTLSYKRNGELLFHSEKNLDISEGKVSPGHLSISKKIGYFFFFLNCVPAALNSLDVLSTLYILIHSLVINYVYKLETGIV